jgi:hypothetical protein
MLIGVGSRPERAICQFESNDRSRAIMKYQGERAVMADEASRVSTPAPVRRPLPEHLPREVIEHQPQAPACPNCGGAWKRLGEDISNVLEYVPASFKVVQHVRPKLARTCCDRMMQAPAPSRPIARVRRTSAISPAKASRTRSAPAAGSVVSERRRLAT